MTNIINVNFVQKKKLEQGQKAPLPYSTLDLFEYPYETIRGMGTNSTYSDVILTAGFTEVFPDGGGGIKND